MRIGIDIDDTTLETLSSMINYGSIYNEQVLNKQPLTYNLGTIKDRYYMNALFGWDEETKFSFFNMYYKNVLENCTPKASSEVIIPKLKKEGNEIYFISARITSIPDCNAEQISIDSMNKYKIPFDKVIIGAYNKLEYCLEHGIEVFIDDSLEVLQELSKHGIRCYLMTSPINSKLDTGNIKRVYSWEEIYQDLKEVTYDTNISKRKINKPVQPRNS